MLSLELHNSFTQLKYKLLEARNNYLERIPNRIACICNHKGFSSVPSFLATIFLRFGHRDTKSRSAFFLCSYYMTYTWCQCHNLRLHVTLLFLEFKLHILANPFYYPFKRVSRRRIYTATAIKPRLIIRVESRVQSTKLCYYMLC